MLKGFSDIGEVLMVSWAFAAFTNGELGFELSPMTLQDSRDRYYNIVLLWTM
jgi:hypothetical protein